MIYSSNNFKEFSNVNKVQTFSKIINQIETFEYLWAIIIKLDWLIFKNSNNLKKCKGKAEMFNRFKLNKFVCFAALGRCRVYYITRRGVNKQIK